MKRVLTHVPCPICPSTDAYCEWEDGHGYCFSCSYYKSSPSEVELSKQADTIPYTYEYLPFRGITRETMEAYDVRTRIAPDGTPVAVGFPYEEDAILWRSLTEKKFWWEGNSTGASLFGWRRYLPGSAQACTITEGALDALSAFQMLGSKYPSVSVRSAQSARKDCLEKYDYINSFDKIYVAFDDDNPGRKAATEVASLFNFNKVYKVPLEPYKDANDWLTNGKEGEFRRAWFQSKRFLLQGITSSFEEFSSIIDAGRRTDGWAYPFPTLQDMTYGIRPGEMVIVTGLEGIGKTEVIRAIEYSLFKGTDLNIGTVHLEEDKLRQLQGLAGYELKTPCHLPDATVSKEEIKKAIKEVLRRDERAHLYSHFETDDPDVVLEHLRFMAGPCECRVLFLDNIQQLIAGLDADDERKKLDYLSVKLSQMSQDLQTCIFVISHVNDDGLTRGSRYISKTAYLWIHLDRALTASDILTRNSTFLTIKKNRFAGKTGPAGRLWFDPQTFTMAERELEVIDDKIIVGPRGSQFITSNGIRDLPVD